MNKITESRAGYILIFSLLMLATLSAIATYIMTRGSIYIPFMKTVQEREKALLIAHGGIEVAIAQLSRMYTQEDIEKNGNKIANKKNSPPSPETQKGSPEKQFLLNFLPTINRWQEYNLHENVDGIDGRIRICITCEEGKININNIYDYQKKQFYGKGQPEKNWEAIMQELCQNIERIQGSKNLFGALETFLKKREYKLLDVTELLHVKEFELFRDYQFYAPPESSRNNDQKNLYLTDIFTIDSFKRTVNPWFFSNALLTLLSLPEAQVGDVEARITSAPQWLENFHQPKSWKNDWQTLLQPIYQKNLASLPKNIESIFDTSTNPRIFSVISEGKVGTVTKQLFALIERTKHTYKDKTRYDVKIKKLYWL